MTHSTSSSSNPTSPPIAHFTFPWKIEWQEFRKLHSQSIVKNFITSYKNVIFHWKAELQGRLWNRQGSTGIGKIKLCLLYEGGPLENLKNINCVIDVMTKNETYERVLRISSFAAKRRGEGKCIEDFGDLDLAIFRKKHNLEAYTPLIYLITLSIPSSAFSYFPSYTFSGGSLPPWIVSQYRDIKNPNSKDSDIRLISGDGKKYFCHRNVLGRQVAALSAMFDHPTTPEERQGVFRFPSLRHEALEIVLEFLYTGETILTADTFVVIEAADFAEQYGLAKLKESCAACLWDRISQNWQDCFSVAAFAALHDDLICLKDRAFDILVDYYEKVPVEMLEFSPDVCGSGKVPSDLSKFSQDVAGGSSKGKGRKRNGQRAEGGNQLRNEFYLHMKRRVEGYVK